jgi:hypothetical protein
MCAPVGWHGIKNHFGERSLDVNEVEGNVRGDGDV